MSQNTYFCSFYFLKLYRKVLTPLPQLYFQVLEDRCDRSHFWAQLHLFLMGRYFESFYVFVIFFCTHKKMCLSPSKSLALDSEGYMCVSISHLLLLWNDFFSFIPLLQFGISPRFSPLDPSLSHIGKLLNSKVKRCSWPLLSAEWLLVWSQNFFYIAHLGLEWKSKIHGAGNFVCLVHCYIPSTWKNVWHNLGAQYIFVE